MPSRRTSRVIYQSFFILLWCCLSYQMIPVADSYTTPQEQTATSTELSLEKLDNLAKFPGNLAALPDVPVPTDNPQARAKIELGKRLFFDKRLSLDNSLSCASCHDPAKGFSDGLPVSIGLGGKALHRHSPTILNAAYNSRHHWDGRAGSLEEQVKFPLISAAEMGMGDEARVVARVRSLTEYQGQFQEIFGETATMLNIEKSIAAYERTLVTPDAPFDRYARGDKQALTEPQKRGLILFIGKAACIRCHNGINFTDNHFYNLGVKNHHNDEGRFGITKEEKDKHCFKTPTLRNIALSPPYMHNGEFNTLSEVIDFYDEGGGNTAHRSPLVTKLHLSKNEKADLVEFLNSLTGKLPGE